MSVRARRLDNEWKLLAQLVEHNPGVLEPIRRETLPDADVFHVILHRTSALALGDPPRLMEFASHTVAFRYLSFYPSVPIEAFLATPVFHPNVHPENGFVCLWDRFSPGDTIVEAVRKLQQVITWQLWNGRAEHVMQPEALGRAAELSLALTCTPVDLAPSPEGGRNYVVKPRGWKQRLTECG
jgi:ubiquitin-protein ligase